MKRYESKTKKWVLQSYFVGSEHSNSLPVVACSCLAFLLGSKAEGIGQAVDSHSLLKVLL